MRQQIDCAVLSISIHRTWLDHALKQVEPAAARIRMHYLDWESELDVELEHPDIIAPTVNIDIQAFAKSSVSLRRYDICLIPVSLDTLGWTRQALAAIPRGPFVPLIGVFSGLRSAAMQDLLELGLADFVRLPLCPDEYRARILSTVSKVPRPGNSLREPELIYPASPAMMRANTYQAKGQRQVSRPLRTINKNSGLQTNLNQLNKKSDQEVESFRLSKACVVEQFEREYVTRALEQNNGNIAKAARASDKHRRAFWALMRKYKIDAGLYRLDEDEE